MTAYYAPDDITKALHISTSTLRKYALLLEKVGYEIEKNAQGQRWYTDTDIITLKKFMTFSKSGGMTLEEAAQAVYLWHKGGEVARHDTTLEARPSATQEATEQLFSMLENMKAYHEEHKQDVEKLTEIIAIQSQEISAMREELEKLSHRAEIEHSQVEKKGFFARLFNK